MGIPENVNQGKGIERCLGAIFPAFREVFSQKQYYFITALAAAILYSLNAALQNISLLYSNFSWALLWSLVIGLRETFTLGTYAFLITITLLGAVITSFSIYMLRRQIATGAAAGTGIVAAVLAPACPACALGSLSVLGLGGIIGFLPLRGVELGILALLVLVAALLYLCVKVNTKVCAPRFVK